MKHQRRDLLVFIRAMARVALITLLALVVITTEALLTSRNDHYLSVGEFQVIPINSNPPLGDYPFKPSPKCGLPKEVVLHT